MQCVEQLGIVLKLWHWSIHCSALIFITFTYVCSSVSIAKKGLGWPENVRHYGPCTNAADGNSMHKEAVNLAVP